VTRINNGLSTHEDECAAINGSDYEDNVRTLLNENGKLAEANSIFNKYKEVEPDEED
jgi:predicted subunit of tRNA(5-methylaminomethyl-2-thiouridylate) methyltransferase